ncbi:MAG: membrane protein insertase YidC, partial [Aeoliella sp.]
GTDPVERRYLAFFAMSFAILVLWNSIFPPAAPVKPKNPPADGGNGVVEDNGAAGRQALDAELPSLPPPDIVAPPVVNSPPFVTLGSLTPGGSHRLLATFNSRGATIRRLELSSLKFRDLHDKSGYLGQLELIDSPDGALVQVVGPGTPAAEAGIEVDDVIVAIEAPGNRRLDGGEVVHAEDVGKLLEKSKARDSVEVTLLREGAKKTISVPLIARPLDLIRPEKDNILLHSDTVPEDFEDHPTLELSLQKVGPQPVAEEDLAVANRELANGVWAIKTPADNRVEFSMILPRLGIEVVKRFEIPSVPEESRAAPEFMGYHLEFDVEIRNLRPQPQTVTYRLQGPNGLPIEGWWYSNKVGRSWSGYGIRDVVLRVYGESEKDFPCRDIVEDDVKPYGDGKSLAYIGVDAQYFAAVILPEKKTKDEKQYALFKPNLASFRFDKKTGAIVEEKKSYKQKYGNASFQLTSREIKLAAMGDEGDRYTNGSRLFAGPKRPELLLQYKASDSTEETLEDFVYYGWFGNLGIPQFMVWILGGFYGIVKNYGVAIIMLTVLVRSCMFPLSRKQAKNMMKMQELKPEMDRITARHKDDAQARTKAQQELWASHNYNPMGGCLLMFLQFPIFIGLYRALMVEVELRQASLIPGLHWCSNLAAPDMLWNWAGMWPNWFVNGEGILALGPYLNILPLATVGLFLLQQKLFMPPPTDDQSRMMQKMMKYMMIFMSFMFFKVAAGLCLYFIASSLWGIAERKLIPSPTQPSDDEPEEPTEREPPPRKSRKRKKGKRKR